MSQYDDSGVKTFLAAGAISKGARVKISAAETIDNAGLAEKEIGTALQAAFAAGDRVAVKLRTAAGTHKMIAAAAIAVGATVFTAASGKVSVSASTAFQVGSAVEAAGANNDVIEVLYNAHGDTAVP
jgi:predicted RecA/RadA family phage recombinase